MTLSKQFEIVLVECLAEKKVTLVRRNDISDIEIVVHVDQVKTTLVDVVLRPAKETSCKVKNLLTIQRLRSWGLQDSLTLDVEQNLLIVTSLKDEHSQAQSEFNSANTKLVECDSQICCIRNEQEKLKDMICEKIFEQKRLESEVKRTEIEQKNCSLKVDKLINKHACITFEKHFFGRSGSDYDFTSRDPHRARDQLENLEAQQAVVEELEATKMQNSFCKIDKADDCIVPEVEKSVVALPDGGVLLLDNVRFYKDEEKNGLDFVENVASLADLIN
ncbi:RecF/RecN/SMC [Artemisia annua]|uniref:phosphoglycerate kinase n=1 Tax=Artemisia annua TaxID=35608 RepID=A0A2U1LPA7_ARTAN|nr:RecF/RecN/SMC [Artemisia annua]